MADYKQLYFKSQAEIADTIDILEQIINNLKKYVLDCEETIMSSENIIIIINPKESNEKSE